MADNSINSCVNYKQADKQKRCVRCTMINAGDFDVAAMVERTLTIPGHNGMTVTCSKCEPPLFPSVNPSIDTDLFSACLFCTHTYTLIRNCCKIVAMVVIM